MANEPVVLLGNEEESAYIRKRLIEFNAEHVPENLSSRFEEINLTIKDDSGKVIGGLLSTLCWNWIEVEILWVEESQRGLGYGSHLLHQIERIAKEKGCTFIKLNTFSFQAPEFYQKNAYIEVAVFKDAPLGSNHYYFKKAIF
ncbi:GNAT family N-acetyltransferase [Paenibacillus sp. YAF4_2]|uniref:GNAT family N-acetyltransferase n=1 Tax=Paenibacillus sp. YAF4_2 TaxID=3233085 RepID=UPI003F99F097